MAGLGIPGTHITFIGAEGVEAMVAETGIPLEPHQTRRNVLVRGVDVPGLVGRRFQVGDAVCYGVKECNLQPSRVAHPSRRPGALRPAASGRRPGRRADPCRRPHHPSSPTDRSRAQAAALAHRSRASGLFEPGSVSWRVDREAVVLAGGTCALLMQVAHPAVAAGVDAHSDFRADPFARLRRTLGASWAIVFGDGAASGARDPPHQRSPRAGPGRGVGDRRRVSRARPGALLWVHATLVDTAVRMHHRFVAPLTATEMDDYHLEAAEVAVRLGVPEAMLPPTFAGLRALDGCLVASGEVKVGPTTPQPPALHPLSQSRSRLDSCGMRPMASVSLLDPRIRRQYGLPWNRRGTGRGAPRSRQPADRPAAAAGVRHVPASRRSPTIMAAQRRHQPIERRLQP